jgi:hypothetical protein
MCRKSCCSSVLSNKRAGERVPSIGRKIGCVQRIGHAKNYRFASKKPSARAVFKRARPRHAVSSAQPRSRTSVLALRQPSLGRRSGLVRMMGHIKISRIWSRNCREPPDSCGEACPGHTIPTAAHTQRGSGRPARAVCPPANPPGARPPACVPARPPERRTRARTHPCGGRARVARPAARPAARWFYLLLESAHQRTAHRRACPLPRMGVRALAACSAPTRPTPPCAPQW